MKAKEQFFRRVVFNVVARNQDDHTKNIAFLMDKKGQWSLAPAYDLCFSYNPQGAWTSSHQMTIGGKADGFTTTDLMDLAAGVKLGRKAASIVDEVIQSVSTWRSLAEEEGLCEPMIEEVARHQRLQLPV
jgi:serine/threonine-protein kinase HipA